MTLLSYEIFQTIIDQGSFAKAANLMHLTPSAVSHAVSSMEEEIGFPLFIRNKSGIQLTSAGEEIAPYIQKTVAANNNLYQMVAKMNGLKTGNVKIGCINTVCITWIPPIIRKFQEDYPQIDIEVYQGSYTDVINWVKSGVIDLGIISSAANDGLPFIELCQDPLVCVTPKGYMPSTTEAMTPDDLKDQPFVIQQDSCDKDIITFLDNYKLSVRANCHVLDDQSTMAMVECGAGMSIIPKLFLQSFSCNVDVYPLQPEQYRTLGIICLNTDFVSPAAGEMIVYMKDYVKSNM